MRAPERMKKSLCSNLLPKERSKYTNPDNKVLFFYGSQCAAFPGSMMAMPGVFVYYTKPYGSARGIVHTPKRAVGDPGEP